MNKFNLVLTASGFNDINNYVSDEMIEFFASISKNKKIMILANAAPKNSGNYIARENVKENFLKVGAIKVDIVDLDFTNLEIMLEYDIIYGIGGDSTPLIELNTNPKFKETMLQFLKNGIYIGESAGTAILYHDLKWIYEIKHNNKPNKYSLNLPTYKGLGLTEYNIFPHYNKLDSNTKTIIKNYELSNNFKIIKLNDGEFIIVNYEEIENISADK